MLGLRLELGYMGKIKPEFDRRGVKIIGLSVDSTADHERWAADIEETQGARPDQLEARRGRHHRRLRPEQRAREIFGEWKEPKPYIRIVPQPVCGAPRYRP